MAKGIRSSTLETGNEVGGSLKSGLLSYKSISIFLAVLVVLLLAYHQLPVKTSIFPSIRVGDVVYFNYVGAYLNGSIFDSSIAEVADAAGIYDSKRQYGPLVVVVGDGKVISGLDAALVGMRVGDFKQVFLAPEEAFGERKADALVPAPREQWAPRVISTSVERFVQDVGKQPNANETLLLPDLQWPMTVLAVVNGTVYLRHDPQVGQVVDTNLGPAVVSIEERVDEEASNLQAEPLGDTGYLKVAGDLDQILAELNSTGVVESVVIRPLDPKVGTIISTGAGLAVVRNVSNDTITLDFNHPLAGESLVFNITITAVNYTEGG
ncbi:FKBP-type peptidyl-prolyl cis-trans isomerase [uncultured archaeon]|nr:FKBP-type peptidyl-prolyl cis-trans isomerase [uncultured archaeon]